MPQDERASPPSPLSLLSGGEIELQGRLPWSSNHTFLASCGEDGRDLLADAIADALRSGGDD